MATKAKPQQDAAAPRPAMRARGRARVEKIIASTADLLKRHELSELTIMMIADHAGVGRSSVYEFFPTVSAILRVLAERYTSEIVERAGRLLVDLKSHTLPDIVDIMIDGSADFWNDQPAAAKIHLGSDTPFGLRVMTKDFHRAGAAIYHQWHKPDWDIRPMGDDDPFRILSVLQYAMFSESVQRHGRITDYFRNETKLVARAYLSHYTRAIQPLNDERIATAGVH